MKVNVNYYDVVVNGILLASILNCNYVNAGATRDVQRSEYINPKHNTLKQQYQWRNLIGDANDQQSKHHSIHKHHQKRQIYREQVLPHAGGKIPDSAFDTDRLALNRLQKDGIAVPDGVLLEQRNPHVFQYASKSRRPVYTVKQFSDQRFTAAAGQGTGPDGSKTVETTYSLPQIVHHTLTVPRDPIEPVLQSIELPNPLLQSGPPKRREQYGMNVSCGPRPHQHHAQALSSNPFANHFSYSKKYLSNPSPLLNSIYPTYMRLPIKMWSHQHQYLPQAHAVASQATAAFAQPPIVNWNYALPHDQLTNVIFGDFQSIFNSLQHSVYQPGHIGQNYYKHHVF